jgi:hypothetical protein
MLAMLRKLRAQAERSPAAVLRWISITRRYARYDLSADEMFRLGVVATHVRPRDVTSITVPVSIGSVGAASVVFISPSARSLYERFRERASL